MLAVVIFFWRDLVRITRTWLASLRRPELRGELDARMGWYVIIATIPIGVAGLAFRDQIENGARNLYLIGDHADRARPDPPAPPRRWARARAPLDDVGRADAIWVGIAQALALVPGHLALGRDDHRRPLPRAWSARRRRASRSCSRSRPIVLSGLFGLTELINGDDDVSYGALDDLHGRRVRRRLRVDRLPAALPGLPLDDDLRGLPGRARRPRDRPRPRAARSAERAGTLDHLELARQIDQLEHTLDTASEGRAMRERAAGVGRQACAPRAATRRPDESMKPTAAEVEHDRARAARGQRPRPGAGRRRGRARPRRRSGPRPGAPRRATRKVVRVLVAHAGEGIRGPVRPRRFASARRTSGTNARGAGGAPSPRKSVDAHQDEQSTPPSASVSSWSTCRWCAALARRYADRGEPLDDLVQVGTIGLIKAIDRFEPERGFKLASFATPTILGRDPAPLPRPLVDRSGCRAACRRRARRSRRPSPTCRPRTAAARRSARSPSATGLSMDEVLDALAAGSAQRPGPSPRPGTEGEEDAGRSSGVEERGYEQAEARATLDAGPRRACRRASA